MTDKILRADSTQIASIISCTFKESVNADECLRFGSAVASSIEFSAYGAQTDAPAVGEVLTYYQTDGNGVDTLIGKFIATPSVPSKNAYTVTAYDSIILLEADFTEQLAAIQSSFPMTLNALLSEVATVAGVTFGNNPTLGSTSIAEFSASGVSCRQVVAWAAEMSGQYVYADTSGNICFGWYSTVSGKKVYKQSGSSGGVTYVPYRQDGLDYKDFAVSAVDGVAVFPPEVEGAAAIYPSAATGNMYNVRDNLLLSGASAATLDTVAQTLYTVLSALTAYRPCSIQLFRFDNPFRAGDIIAVEDAQGVSFNTLVMSMTVNMDGATVECTGRETYDGDYGTSYRDEIVNLASNIVRIDKLKVGYAEIADAVINVLKANTIDAEWISSSVVNTNEVSLKKNLPFNVANVADPDSMYNANNVIVDGWITNANSDVVVAWCNGSEISVLSGETLTVTYEYTGQDMETEHGGEISYEYLSGDFWLPDGEIWTFFGSTPPTTIIAYYENGEPVYKLSKVLSPFPNYPLRKCLIKIGDTGHTTKIRNISLTSTASLPEAKLDGYGLEIGNFTIDRSGNAKANGNAVLDAGDLSNTNPADLGTATPGTSTEAARADHVHNLPSIPAAATALPQPLGTAAVGTSTKYARENHVHKMPSASDVGALPTGTTPADIGAISDTDAAHRMVVREGGTGTVSVTITSGTNRGLLFVSSGTAARNGLYIVHGGSTGTISCVPVLSSSVLSFDTATTGVLKITNSSAVYMYMIWLGASGNSNVTVS